MDRPQYNFTSMDCHQCSLLQTVTERSIYLHEVLLWTVINTPSRGFITDQCDEIGICRALKIQGGANAPPS